MPSDRKRNDIAESRNMIALTTYERRAGDALRSLIAGPHADKLTARTFGCSVRLAQHLRRGRCWTVQRLSQASAVLGVAFDQALHYSPATSAQHFAEMAEIAAIPEIAERLARVEAKIAEMDRGDIARLAPPARPLAGTAGRRDDAPVPPAAADRHGVGHGAAASRQGVAVAAPVRAERRNVRS